ncbi:ribosome recycling factor [Stomatohabitans albus]|uniref:ribosome recycling factor n=1 Tax=Stomatohabitans albus TaxID=3110766 RepID=UPI00300C75BF
MIDDVLAEATTAMEGAIEHTRERLSRIRTGRANPQLLTNLRVEYYGTPTPMQQVASVTAPEARVLLVTPYDASALSNIEKAILSSDLGLNPSNDGKVVRVVFPELTEDRRKEFVKMAKEQAEEGRISIRNIRRKMKDQIGELELSEDEERRAENRLQDVTDKYVKQVDEILSAKESDLMQV